MDCANEPAGRSRLQTDHISPERGSGRNSGRRGKEGANPRCESRELLLLEFVTPILIFSLCWAASQRARSPANCASLTSPWPSMQWPTGRPCCMDMARPNDSSTSRAFDLGHLFMNWTIQSAFWTSQVLVSSLLALSEPCGGRRPSLGRVWPVVTSQKEQASHWYTGEGKQKIRRVSFPDKTYFYNPVLK